MYFLIFYFFCFVGFLILGKPQDPSKEQIFIVLILSSASTMLMFMSNVASKLEDIKKELKRKG